jgi:hypothetical protein
MSQMERWTKLSERFSLIPLKGKVPIGQGWQKWCEEKKPFNPNEFEGKNAGIACGPASGIIVLDIDETAKFKTECEKQGWETPGTMTVKTGSGKYHLYYAYPTNGHKYRCTSYKLTDGNGKITLFDVRGIGGQVVGPESIHPDTGQPYKIVKDIDPFPAPSWILDLVRDDSDPTRKNTHNKGSSWNGDIHNLPISREVKGEILNGVNVPYRSEAILRVCNSLVFANLTDDEIVGVFDRHPIGDKYREKGRNKDKWLQKHIKKAREYVTDRATQFESPIFKDVTIVTNVTDVTSVTNVTSCNQSVTRNPKSVTSCNQESDNRNLLFEVKDWLTTVDGVFTIRDIEADIFLNISPPLKPPLKNYLKQILHRLVENRTIERVGSIRGTYRKIDTTLEESPWWDADTEEYPIILPLGLTDLLKIMPKNVIVCAGEKSAAKSAFALNVAKLNIPNLQCRYFNSEGGPEEYKNRLMNFEDVPLSFWRKMPMYEKSHNIEDYIFPDDLNIVDYLEVNEDFFKVGLMIRKIYDRLNRGIAIINLQKDPNCSLGRGASMSIEKARLYLTLGVHKDDRGMIFNKATIVDAKTPRDRDRHPKGMVKTFRIYNGAIFSDLTDWHFERGA